MRELFDVIRFAVNGGEGAQEFYDGLRDRETGTRAEAMVTLATNEDLSFFLAQSQSKALRR